MSLREAETCGPESVSCDTPAIILSFPIAIYRMYFFINFLHCLLLGFVEQRFK